MINKTNKTSSTSITILGIDPGTATTGFGIIEKRGPEVFYIDHGCILTSSKLPFPERLEKIFDELGEIIKNHKPSHIAVEELFFSTNSKTAIAVGQARGVVLLSAKKNNLSFFEYTPLEVKMALTGYGRAEKSQIQQMVKAICSLPEIPKPDDAADALAVALCHAQTYRELNQ